MRGRRSATPAQAREFRIPMRGNEVGGGAGIGAQVKVSNPHEG